MLITIITPMISLFPTSSSAHSVVSAVADALDTPHYYSFFIRATATVARYLFVLHCRCCSSISSLFASRCCCSSSSSSASSLYTITNRRHYTSLLRLLLLL